MEIGKNRLKFTIAMDDPSGLPYKVRDHTSSGESTSWVASGRIGLGLGVTCGAQSCMYTYVHVHVCIYVHVCTHS